MLVWATFAVHMIFHLYHFVVVEGEGLKFYMNELTRWSLVTELVYFTLLVGATCCAQSSTDTTQPLTVKVAVVLFTIVHPLAVFVTGTFWTFNTPVHKLCIVSQAPDCLQTPGYLSIFAHGINLLLCLVSFLVGRIPFYFANLGWFVAFLVAYIMWTIIHYNFSIGTPYPCDAYEQHDCPIYSQIDWHRPKQKDTLVFLVLMMLVGASLSACICRLLACVRDLCNCCSRWQLPVHDAPQST